MLPLVTFWKPDQVLVLVWVFATLWIVALQASLSMGFFRQKYWSGLPFPSPGNLSNPGIEPGYPALQADSLPLNPPGNKLDEKYSHWTRFLKDDFSRSLIMLINSRNCSTHNISCGKGEVLCVNDADLRIVLENTEYQIEDTTNPKKCSNVIPDFKTITAFSIYIVKFHHDIFEDIRECAIL